MVICTDIFVSVQLSVSVGGTDTVLVSTIKLKRLEVLTLFEPAVLSQHNDKYAQLRHITALC